MNKTFSQEAQRLLDQLARLTGRPTDDRAPANTNLLARPVNQLNDVHAELTSLLRGPGISGADYDQLWDAHKYISKALDIMLRVQRRGETH